MKSNGETSGGGNDVGGAVIADTRSPLEIFFSRTSNMHYTGIRFSRPEASISIMASGISPPSCRSATESELATGVPRRLPRGLRPLARLYQPRRPPAARGSTARGFLPGGFLRSRSDSHAAALPRTRGKRLSTARRVSGGRGVDHRRCPPIFDDRIAKDRGRSPRPAGGRRPSIAPLDAA